MANISRLERDMYTAVSNSRTGLSPSSIARALRTELLDVRQALTVSPLFRELCYESSKGLWRPMISRSIPHYGLEHFCRFYSTAEDFMTCPEEEFHEEYSTPALFRKYLNMQRCTVRALLIDIASRSAEEKPDYKKWEVCFGTEISVAKIRLKISCDCLVINERGAYALQFFNAAAPQSDIAEKTYNSSRDLSLIFGPACPVTPVSVLTRASEHFSLARVREEGTDKNVCFPVCSRDRLYRALELPAADSGEK